MKRFLFIILISVMFITIGPGCTSKTEDNTSDLVPMRFGHFGIYTYKDLFIADAMGFFEENGVDMELTKMTTTDIVPSIVGGHLDGGAPSTMTALPAVAAGADIKVVVSTTHYQRPEHIGYICVLNDSPAQTIKDLDGKTISGHVKGGGPDLWVQVAAEENNIEFSQYVGAPASQFQPMLIAEKVDSAIFFGRDREVKFKGQVREIYPLTASVTFGDYGYWFSGKYIQEHPDAVKGFVAAIQQAREYYNNNTDDALKVTADYVMDTYEDLQLAREANCIMGYPPEVEIEVWSFNSAQEMLVKYGVMNELLDINGFVDTSFAKPVMEMPENELDWLPEY